MEELLHSLASKGRIGVFTPSNDLPSLWRADVESVARYWNIPLELLSATLAAYAAGRRVSVTVAVVALLDTPLAKQALARTRPAEDLGEQIVRANAR